MLLKAFVVMMLALGLTIATAEQTRTTDPMPNCFPCDNN